MQTTNKGSKIWTIIKHEYMTKLKSKGFIIGTFLGPFFLLLFFGVIFLVAWLSQGSGEKKLAILDKTGKFGAELVSMDSAKYFLTNENEETLQNKVLDEELDGYLIISADIFKSGEVKCYTGGGGGIGYIQALRSRIDDVIRKNRLLEAGVSQEIIDFVDKGIDVKTEKVTKKGTEKDYTEIYAVIGYVLGFSIYILMFMYGSFVMRGVIEEKANRIVEIIASSAKPFEIMFGKVVGIGAVGLTQVLFWIIIVAAVLYVAEPVINMLMGDPKLMKDSMAIAAQGQSIPENFEIPYISPLLGVAFVFYFLSGYFIYSTLFAAVGSAVDQESDAASLQTPITMPIIIPMLFIPYLMSNPDGTLSIILSLIPFFSPILMMVRLAASNVPVWQIALSVILMISTFFGTLWVTSKIYRVGILMYGKKVKIKDLIKWVRLAK
ncbi:MAG: hypothetical protein QG635_1416 [Bacteroidota bacterium]|nr:hypothetical protein [Bacteroidota bacterium]